MIPFMERMPNKPGIMTLLLSIKDRPFLTVSMMPCKNWALSQWEAVRIPVNLLVIA